MEPGVGRWEPLNWVCWEWGEREQWRLRGEGSWVGWGCCWEGQKVLSVVVAVAAVVGLLAGAAAAVEADADVVALHC